MQRLRALRLVLGDLATRKAAIARENGDQEAAAEGMRQVQAESLESLTL